jgi:phosphoribosylanthranilate isomerase
VVRVKICGLTCVDEAVACAELGAQWIGLNFHPPSPRYVAPEQAAAIVAALPPSASAVGIFVDRPVQEIAEAAARAGIGIIQLHGQEREEDLVALGSLQIIQAFRLDRAAAWSRVIDYVARAGALGRLPDAVLIDAYVPGQLGGTGSLVADAVIDSIPPLPRLILAGGLNPDNVVERARRARPWMVDVASGVERSPGQKDLARVEAFIRAARTVSLDEPEDGGGRLGG